MSELTALGKTSSCAKKTSDKVRLISFLEYYNMSPYYSETNSSYPNVENITRISTASDYASWLYCSSSACGSSDGDWWTMGSYFSTSIYHVSFAISVYSIGDWGINRDNDVLGVRPVITIVK